jgi:hypothetical protein
MIHVTDHAMRRFAERVTPCSLEEAKAAILSHSRALETAVQFDCQVVKLGDGSKLILQGNRVVTVQARYMIPRQCLNPYREGVR